MKKLLLGVFAMGLTFALFAQEPTFQKGDNPSLTVHAT